MICARHLLSEHTELKTVLEEERSIDISWIARINIILDEAIRKPGELERKVNCTSDSNETEEIVENMSVLSCKNQAKLALLETIDLQSEEK